MGISEESLLLENIQEFINDENRIVTCRWLSLTMRIHINIAKQALCNFVNEERNKGGNDDINVTYFVSGFGESKLGQQILKCVVVPETDLEAVKSSLNPVTSCHIYSVQKAKLKDYTALYQTDFDVIKENLHDINKYSSIRCPWATLSNKERTSTKHSSKDSTTKAKPAQEENVSSPNLSSSKDSSAKPTEKSKAKNKTSQIASMFAAAGKKDKKETSTPEVEKEAKSKDKPKETKGGVMSFFKSQPEKQTDKKPTEEVNASKKGSKSSSTKKQKDDTDDSGPQRKRRRIRTDLFDSSDEDEGKEEEEEEELYLAEQPVPPEPESHEEEEMEVEPKEEKSDSPKKEKSDSPKKHKTTEKSTVSEKKTESHISKGRKRKRIRRLVPKQHIDEDGFMVTEKVWESDSTDASDEEEVQPQQKISSKAPPKTSPPVPLKTSAGTKKKAAKASPSKNKQTSLTSFFKKK